MTGDGTPAPAPATLGPSDPLARIGAVVHFRPGEHGRVERLAAALKAMGLGHIRTGLPWTDLETADGLAWAAWLMTRLARHCTVLPAIACDALTPPATLADAAERFAMAAGDAVNWVELWPTFETAPARKPASLAPELIDAAIRLRALGRRVVLGGIDPGDQGPLDALVASGHVAAFDALGLHVGAGANGLAALARLPTLDGWAGEVWITESGYATWRNDEPEQIGAFCALLEAPVARAYWCALEDRADLAAGEPVLAAERHRLSGLMREGGGPKLLMRLLCDGGVTRLAWVADLQRRRQKGIRRAATLITGGAGFIGANLADRLASEGERVLVYDNLSRPGVERNLEWLKQRHGERIEVEIGDLRDRRRLTDAVNQAERIYHFAAQTAVTTSLDDPWTDFEVNARGTLGLLEAVRRRANPPPVVMASTNKLYGEGVRRDALIEGTTRFLPANEGLGYGIAEDHPIELVSPYGCSKGVADQYVLDYARMFDIPAVVFRMSCIYGPRQFGTVDQGWVAHFLKSALGNAPITIYGNGKQVRDVLYVDDAVAAYVMAQKNMARVRGQVFNLGGGPANAISLLDLLVLMARVNGRPADVRFDAWRPGDQLFYVSDTRKFAAATGWRPRVGVEDGIGRLHAWLGRFLSEDGARDLEPQKLPA